MRRLSHVAFAHPIPIPGTHRRLADFSARDGWTITDEDGRITLEQGETRFYTYVSASCVEAPVEPLKTHPVTADAPRALNAPSPEQEAAMARAHAQAGRQNEQIVQARKGKR